MNIDAIPVELRALPRWIVWRWEPDPDKPDKPRKPPYCPTDLSRHASSTKPETWTTFEQAVAVVDAGKADGIGFALEPPWVLVDLDAELPGPDQGAVMFLLDSYSELSPSGAGYHVVVRASLNGHGRHPEGIGVFQTARFAYFTGEHVHGTPETIEDRQAELERVLAHYLPAPELPPAIAGSAVPVGLGDQELLELMFAASNGDKIRRLWEGDTSAHDDDDSRADLALLAHLAYWTQRDPVQMERLFSASALGRRQKWQGRIDYRARSIEKAITGCKEVYEPFSRNVGPTSNGLKASYKEKREVRTDIPGKCDLAAVLEAFGELLVLPDPGAVEISLAAIVANYADGDAVWPLLVGAPGCGKSEIVTATTEAPDVWSLSSLTPQTLVSGFERKGRDKRPPPSLLLQIGDFGILAFKDLTTVLTMHREARAEIIGQLREVADGKMDKSFGNGLRVEWEGKIGLLAGVTPVIDEQHAFLSVMGERFLLYRMPEVTRRKIAARALKRRGHELELRERIRAMVAEFVAGYRNVGRLELPDKFTEPLITLADIVTRARSGVARDYQSREILYLPEPEAPTRLAKQIAQLTAAALAIGVDEAEAWRLAQKAGWDCVPAVRTAVIRPLGRMDGTPLTMAELQEETGLPATTVNRAVEDLVVLGLADRHKDANKWFVSQSEIAADYWGSDKEPVERPA